MSKYTSIVFLICVLLWSCDKITSEGETKSLVLKQTVELGAGDCVSNNAGLSVCIDSVTSDSRCPSDVICVWEGNASVKMVLTLNGATHTLILNTNNSSNFPSDTSIGQYNIRLTELKPYPVSTSVIDQKDYKASIVVDELEI